MKYVLDSSVAIKWALPEVDSDTAIRLRDEYRQGAHQLLAPDILPIEVGHALTRDARTARISSANGFALWTDVLLYSPSLVDSLTLMPDAYALSSRMQVGKYDCLYVALAQRESCPVLTADDKLIRAFPNNTASLSTLP